MTMRSSPLAFGLFVLIVCGQIAHAETYGIVDTFKVGGEGKWDYPGLDSVSHRLYLSRETHVMVIDAGSGKLIGDIADTPGVHGIAIASDLGHGFISTGKSNQVKVFDLNTLKVMTTLEVGTKPDAILYDEPSHQVFAFNGHSSNVSVIDAETPTVIATIALGGGPEFAQSDGSGTIFVNIENKNELAALDARQHKVTAHWPLPGCEGPTGLALDVIHHRSFSVCANAKMTILDTLTGKAVATLSIGAHADGAAFDPQRQDAFSSNGDGTLSVVHESDPNHFSVAQTVTTVAGAKTIALDTISHKLYLPAAAAAAGTKGQPGNLAPPGTFVVLVVDASRTP
jgi:YVTN family beta-propeller protein